MKIYFYIGMDLNKILSRKMHKPMCVFEMEKYQLYVSGVSSVVGELSMLGRVFKKQNNPEIIIFEFDELKGLIDEINSYIELRGVKELENEFIKWVKLSAESAIDHKMNFYITSSPKHGDVNDS